MLYTARFATCLLALLCSFAYSGGYAQTPNNTLCKVNPFILARRNANQELLIRSLNYADLSYASPPFSDWGAPKAPYILSADVIPQFAIGGKWSPIALHLTPRFKARIFRNDELAGDSSLPVRTPSYMPGATLYFKWDRLNRNSKYYKFASVSAFHHSNGQDGNSLNPDCTYNQYNGSFSTNFIEPAVYISRRFDRKPANLVKTKAELPWPLSRLRRDVAGKDFSCADNITSYYDWYNRLGFAQHFFNDANMLGRYGQSRLNIKTGFIRNYVYRDLLAAASGTGKCPTECYL